MAFEKFLVYSASAGSGKTFALSLRYIALLFLGESPSNILAATFTKKAASQMQTRVRDYLLNLEKEKEFLRLLSEEISLEPKKVLEKKPEILSRFLSSQNYILTIDSFIASILRTNALEIGLEPNFITLEKVEILKEFLEDISQKGILEEFVDLTLMMDQQKSNTFLEIMKKLFSLDPILPQKIELLDGNLFLLEKEISFLREKIFLELRKDSNLKEDKILQFSKAPIKEFYKKSLFSKTTLFEHRDYKSVVKKNPLIDKLFLELKQKIKEWLILKESYILSRIFLLYEEYKNTKISKIKASNTLSFDDVSYFTYRLLYNTIKKDFFYFKLDSKFRHILIDEFQDTSTLQFLILKPLIDEIFAGGEERRSFFYVGDPKQSLYRFRGGQEELFNWVANHYKIKVKNLDSNYRSYKNIIESVNNWFKGKMPNYFPQKAFFEKTGYVKVLDSNEIFLDAINEAKKLVKRGIDPSLITFLVFTNDEGVKLQNLATKENFPTILQTSSKLNRLSMILALVNACEYLYRGYEIDLFNLLLRVGIKNPKSIDFSWFNSKLRPLEVLNNLIRIFDFFYDEINILNLLEFASKYDEIGDFLEEFENSRVPIATKSKYGATIMTIHTSKGLEFDYVIVLDRTKKESNNFDKLLFKYDQDLYIQRVFYKFSKRENFDQIYSEVLKNDKSLRNKDRLNVLYVALTRAKKGLIVVKNIKNSVFEKELLMRPFEIGEIEKEDIKKDNILEPSYPNLTKYGVQKLEEKEEKEYDYYAALFGTALHYTLENLKDFTLESLGFAIESTKNRFGAILSEEEILDIKSRITMLIKSSKFQDLIKDSKIFKETPFSFEGELFQVDLMLEKENKILIIDYKSSPKEFYKHKKQVLNYCKIISKLTNKKTEGLIYYLLKEEIFFKKI